jgi:hypothetical protein
MTIAGGNRLAIVVPPLRTGIHYWVPSVETLQQRDPRYRCSPAIEYNVALVWTVLAARVSRCRALILNPKYTPHFLDPVPYAGTRFLQEFCDVFVMPRNSDNRSVVVGSRFGKAVIDSGLMAMHETMSGMVTMACSLTRQAPTSWPSGWLGLSKNHASSGRCVGRSAQDHGESVTRPTDNPVRWSRASESEPWQAVRLTTRICRDPIREAA